MCRLTWQLWLTVRKLHLPCVGSFNVPEMEVVRKKHLPKSHKGFRILGVDFGRWMGGPFWCLVLHFLLSREVLTVANHLTSVLHLKDSYWLGSWIHLSFQHSILQTCVIPDSFWHKIVLWQDIEVKCWWWCFFLLQKHRHAFSSFSNALSCWFCKFSARIEC